MWNRKEGYILIIFLLLTLLNRGLSSPTLQITVDTEKLNYHVEENIYIYGQVKADGQPVENLTVAVEVRDPTASPVVVRTVNTNSLGKYGLNFSLSSQALHGTYTVKVNCNYNGETASNTTIFYVETVSTFTLTVKVGRSTYKLEEPIEIYGNATLNTIPLEGVLVAIEVQDPEGTPVILRVVETDFDGIFSLTFNLPEDSPLGEYSVYASASYQNQKATAETSFQVKQRLSADINGDGKVNIIDLNIVARAWGSYPGHPRWDPRCDLDENGVINIIDIMLVAREYRP